MLSSNPQSSLRVILAAECHLLEKGLWHLISESDSVVVLGQARDIGELPGLARATNAEVVILALLESALKHMLQVLQQLPENMKIVCLVPPASYRLGSRLLEADDRILYLPMTDSLEELLESARLLAREESLQADKAEVCLTDRQLEVLSIVVLGKSNRQIASELCVTQETIKAHLTSIYRKLGVGSRAEAIARYLEAARWREE